MRGLISGAGHLGDREVPCEASNSASEGVTVSCNPIASLNEMAGMPTRSQAGLRGPPPSVVRRNRDGSLFSRRSTLPHGAKRQEWQTKGALIPTALDEIGHLFVHACESKWQRDEVR